MHNEETTQAEHTEKQHLPQTKKTMWRWLWRAGIVLLVLILSPLVFLSTDIGQRSLLQMVDKWSDGLVIGRIEGNIRSGLKLADTRFQANGVNVHVGEVELHIGFQCLLSYQACIENLSLRNTSIEIETHKLPPSTEKEDKPIGEIKLPLAVLVNKVELDNINVKVDDLDIDLKHFHTGLAGQDRQLVVSPTQLEGLRLSLPMQAVENEQHSATKSPPTQPIDWQRFESKCLMP